MHTAGVHAGLGQVPGRDKAQESPGFSPPPGGNRTFQGLPSTLLSLCPTVDLFLISLAYLGSVPFLGPQGR